MTNQPTENVLLQPSARPQQRRRRWLLASFILCVVLPSVLGTLYTTFFASDRYVAGAGFAVRNMHAGGGSDLLGAFTGLSAGGSTSSDGYMVLTYLESRDLLDRLEADAGFRALYGAREIDVVSRLRAGLDVEKVVTYWKRRIDTSYDPTSGIITFGVQAFSAADAQRVAELVLGYAQELVNQLSDQARKDAVGFAQTEVARAEQRLLAALKQVREFRERGESLDPAASAGAQIEILAGLETRLLETQARMAALGGTVDADAPSLASLRRQAEAIESQIKEKSGGLNMAGANEGLSQLLAEYEELQVEKTFAERAYASALASLEAARVDAGRQQRYLAIYSQPSLPEFPLYPRKILYPVLLVVVAAGLWGIGTLLVYSVRDHLS